MLKSKEVIVSIGRFPSFLHFNQSTLGLNNNFKKILTKKYNYNDPLEKYFEK